ncbi:MFS transporter [Timonella sp. A28]|uniref:MFS transporter n=1 Tax=Timonella sp. A28 TaxID=3442640 RepID=UPI003EBA5A03
MPTTGVHIRRAAFSVYVTFFVVGFIFANWAARLPAIRDELEFSASQMGRLLLVGAIGSLLALPTSGWIVQKLGGQKTIIASATLMVGGYALAATTLGDLPIAVTAAGLLLGGIGMGICDAAMNLEGTRVENAAQRALMPRFHGMFSLGTMAGALASALVEIVSLSVAVHMGIALLLGYVLIVNATRNLLAPKHTISHVSLDTTTETHTQPQRSVWSAWKEKQTWMIGFVVLAAALTEGAANDWLSLAIVDGFEVSKALGAFGLFVFLTAMTITRMVGTKLLDMYGRIVVLRICSLCAFTGLALFGLAPWLWLALVGALLWGAGAALGFPMGMSAASDEPEHAAARVSVVATIGYAAFFAGPPILGELAHHVGYRHALLAIMIPVLVGLLIVRAVEERGVAAQAFAARKQARTVGSAPSETK